MSNNPIISIRNSAIYQHNVPIFRNINLDVDKGQFIYIIGKSGTGKTTLFKTLYADIKIQEGDISVCGYDLKHLKSNQTALLRRKIGIVFQDFQLLPDRNVFDNLAFVLRATGWKNKKLIYDQIQATLQSVGLQHKSLSLVYELSEGEQQRIAIARALVNDPELILADEPTGNLDPITSEEIIKLLLHINQTKKTTVVIATHDYVMIEKFHSHILCCENGSIIEV